MLPSGPQSESEPASSPGPTADGAPSLGAPAPGAGVRRFPCGQCGARLEFEPGTRVLRCSHCGHANAVPESGEPVRELDFEQALARLEHEAPRTHAATIRCDSCAAEVDLPPNTSAGSCPFCGSPVVASEAGASRIRPNAVLPFAITRDRAVELFRGWVASRWFAPGGFRRAAFLDASISGIYLPAWTYDAEARTPYTGQRGDAYYVTHTETVMVNGKPQVRTRQVRHVRWSRASGVVENTFDDVLVLATRSLPAPILDALEPWDLTDATGYEESYLAGFRAETYQIDLKEGFGVACGIMRPTIEESVRADIGGDEQRIDSMNPRYSNIRFKHVLLPVWVSAYRFNNTVFRFIVNARTGEVQGDRPWSVAKIALLVLAVLVVVGVIVAVASSR